MNMWVLKSKDEFKKDRIRKFRETIIGSFFVSIFLTLLVNILAKFGFRGRSTSQHDLSWNQMFEHLLYSSIILIPMIMIGFIIATYLDNKLLICDRCYKDKDSNSGKYCSCGGRFVDIEKYKWIENPEE